MKSLLALFFVSNTLFSLNVNNDGIGNVVDLNQSEYCTEVNDVFTLICFDDTLYFAVTDETKEIGIAKKTDIKCECKLDNTIYYPKEEKWYLFLKQSG